MGLEVTTTIAGLDKTWPASGDPRSQGDDHLRLLKDVLKTIFAGSGGNGFSTPIVATEAEINFLSGITSNVQTQINNAPLDQTSYAGADITLKVGQQAFWNVSGATSLQLRTVGNGGIFRLELDRDTINVGAVVAGTYLRPNNAVLGSDGIHREWSVGTNAQAQVASSINENAFALSAGGTLQHSFQTIVTRQNGKHIHGTSKALTTSEHTVTSGFCYWINETATAWSSIGTIVWPAAWTGLVRLTRVF